MARKTEVRQIGRYTYRVTQLGALQGRKAATRLIRLAGPAMATAEGEGAAAAAFGKLLGGLAEEDVEFFCDLFAANTYVEMGGKRPVLSEIFDEHFSGEYEEMGRWLVFSLEVNFGSFFRKLGAFGGAAAAPQEAPGSTSQTDSSGTHGES